MIKIKTSDFLRDTILFGITILLMFTANLMTVFGRAETAVDVLFFAVIMMNIAIISSLIVNIRRDFALLIFVGAYNILLLGRVYTSWFGYHHKLLMLLEADDFPKLFQSLQIVALSLFCVYGVYRAVGPFFYRRESAIRTKGIHAAAQNDLNPIIRRISAVVLYISSIPFFYILFTSGLAVLRNGYLSSYTNTASVPSVISRLSMFFVPAF
ncbi:MAG: O-antigen polysaccharide polymerase Wzy, partial [Ruminococcaceae bacterium]|nr:O-antigen polysaccharide polymerase Wzy [Oscillospiraceae bacterium]